MGKRTPFYLLAFLLLAPLVALGQSNYASVSGTVNDPQQNAIPGATVATVLMRRSRATTVCEYVNRPVIREQFNFA